MVGLDHLLGGRLQAHLRAASGLQRAASAGGFTHLITYDKDMANKHPPHIPVIATDNPSHGNAGREQGVLRLAPSVKATLKWVWSFLKASFTLVVGTCAMVASAGWGSVPLALAAMLLVVVTALRVHVMGWPYRS